jgi:two-component system response regulator DegU
MKKMRIVLADDDPKVCSAMQLVLEQDTDIESIQEANDGASLLKCCTELQPDLILLDWELPSHQPIAHLLANLRVSCPDVRIVAMSGRPMVRKLALILGVDAFVYKGDPPEQLLAVLRGAETPQSEENPPSSGKREK